VVAFDTLAAGTFRILKPHGLPCVLDQTIAHPRWSLREEQREHEAFPGWQEPVRTNVDGLDEQDEEEAQADLILCGSEFCADTLASEGVPRTKLAVVPYGADTTRFRPQPSPRPPNGPLRLLFVGGLVLRKGIQYLLEAAARLGPSRVQVIAIGQRGISEKVLQKYTGLLDSRGFQLHEEMAAAYNTADLYVFPSLVEGSSLSAYEAMASGLPMITTPNAGTVVRDGIEGFIVAPRKSDAIADAVERLADPALRADMGRAARRRAESMGDWKHYGQRLVSALSRLEQKG
jgi:glycosyltransferase involved in cell wall biosynthesis